MSDLFVNDQWRVTDYGIEVVCPPAPANYPIAKARLSELDWLEHMAEKPWVNIEAFIEAYKKALEIHKGQYTATITGAQLSDLEAKARGIAHRTVREVEASTLREAQLSDFKAKVRGIAHQTDGISARSAVSLLGIGDTHAQRTICQRAYAGLIQARAERFIRDGRASDNVEIPREFWWAKGEAALTQNWATGDFETWIDQRKHLEAFGVTFRRSDIERLRSEKTPEQGQQKSMTTAEKVFIGHGHSLVWLELKSFLQDDLHLTIDEFNRVSTAGVATSNRLEQMLDDAAFAFLILTAEDEATDGKLHARENVVHEAGLFQGRLGFTKAILLLEETCEKFSNIDGLGHIPFPTGRIRPAFEDIRGVLKREGLIEGGSLSSAKPSERKGRFQYTHPRTPRDS